MQDPSLAPEALLSENDVSTLLRMGYIRPLDQTPKGFVRVFTVLEKDNTRRRFIQSPDYVNEALCHLNFQTFGVALPDLAALTSDLQFPYATTGDFDGFFSAFPLPESAQVFYGFRYQGRWFVPTRIPTGHCLCPLLAQLSIQVLIDFTLERIPFVVRARVAGRGYIDNIRFAGDHGTADLAMSHFQHLAHMINATFSLQERGSEYNFLGITFDHSLQTTCTTPKTRYKLQSRWSEFHFETATIRQFLQLSGTLVWCFRVAFITPSYAYHIIKFLRRRLSSTLLAWANLDDLIHPWPSLREPLQGWVQDALRAIPRHYGVKEEHQPSTFLFSDSSSEGWGAVMICIRPVVFIHIAYGSWGAASSRHINEKEALATLRGCHQLLPLILHDVSQVTLHLVVDSSSWFGAAQATFPRSWITFQTRSHIDRLVNLAGFIGWQIHWVNSLSQLADVFSRCRYASLTPVLRTHTESMIDESTRTMLQRIQTVQQVADMLTPYMAGMLNPPV